MCIFGNKLKWERRMHAPINLIMQKGLAKKNKKRREGERERARW